MIHTISLRRKSWLIFGFSAQSWTLFHSVCPECFYEIMSREPPDHKPCSEMCPGPQTEQPIHYDASALSRDHTADQILCSGGSTLKRVEQDGDGVMSDLAQELPSFVVFSVPELFKWSRLELVVPCLSEWSAAAAGGWMWSVLWRFDEAAAWHSAAGASL